MKDTAVSTSITLIYKGKRWLNYIIYYTKNIHVCILIYYNILLFIIVTNV